MITEEKAKAYDGALATAKRIISNNCSKVEKLCLECVFPELKESEDERIRKEINTLYSEIDTCISELLKARTDKDSEAEGKALFKMEGLMVATLQDLSCIEDYLEKQKEKGRNITANLLEDGITGVQRELIEFLTNNIDASWVDIIKSADAYAQRIRSMIEKQKEQKPVDFPTTDEEVNEFLETHSKVEVPEKYKTPDFVFSKQEYESYPIISKDTTSVKPAEWSEEDEQRIAEIEFAVMQMNTKRVDTKDKCLAWLKSLRPVSKESLQSHWKPSEDEERLIKTSISFLKDFADKGYENAVECIDWLKSKLNGDACK